MEEVGGGRGGGVLKPQNKVMGIFAEIYFRTNCLGKQTKVQEFAKKLQNKKIRVAKVFLKMYVKYSNHKQLEMEKRFVCRYNGKRHFRCDPDWKSLSLISVHDVQDGD